MSDPHSVMRFLEIFTYATAQIFATFLFAKDFNPDKDVLFLLRIRGRDFLNEDIYQLETKEAIKESSFDPNKPTTFFVHGFMENRDTEHHLNLSQAILDGMDQNLFFVDWGKGSKTILYHKARGTVPDVAYAVGEFVNYLVEENGMKLDDVTLIGFSLGAHVVGIAGQKFISGDVKRVLGLDPAGPLFDAKDKFNRLSPESAQYTECIHTGFFFGIRDPICQTDFYVNGGWRQPGCISDQGVDNVVCSHGRVLLLLAEAIQNPQAFYGKSCEDFESMMTNDCEGEPGAFMFDPENIAKNISGIFYLKTNKKSPFGRGKK